MSLDSMSLVSAKFQALQIASNHGRKLLISLLVISLLATGTVAGEDALAGTQGTGGGCDGP